MKLAVDPEFRAAAARLGAKLAADPDARIVWSKIKAAAMAAAGERKVATAA